MCNLWNLGQWPCKLVLKQIVKAQGPLVTFNITYVIFHTTVKIVFQSHSGHMVIPVHILGKRMFTFKVIFENRDRETRGHF